MLWAADENDRISVQMTSSLQVIFEVIEGD